jgi:DNA-binding transcriptional MerR regulator
MDEPSWTIGELAEQCGLTVRALRHFEPKGLLPAVERTSSGHRVYRVSTVERVYQVVALRGLGLSLAQIADALESPPALARSLADQLAHVEQELADLGALRQQLQRLVPRSETDPPPVEELITLIHQTVTSQDLLREYLDDADREVLARKSAGRAARRLIGGHKSEGSSDVAGPRRGDNRSRLHRPERVRHGRAGALPPQRLS